MPKRPASSRQIFADYEIDLKQRLKSGKIQHAVSPHGTNRPYKPRLRSTSELVKSFYRLLGGQRRDVGIALATLTVATMLALVPPAATKFIVDYVLGENPLPQFLAQYEFLHNRWNFLLVLTVVVTLVSFVKIGLHIWGRWNATRVNKRLQMSFRKQAFEHAIRLPLNRVHELKSGGVSSLLREDAGSAGDLIFGMLYNPWRAIVQLTGSLCILAWVDWRLLLGTVVVLPSIYWSHRTWINRIRPRYRDIRSRREEIDGQSTEAFGGIRIVRAFSRQRSETARFMKSNHVMARQELRTWWWARIIEMIWEALIPVATGALLLYGGWQVLEGALTLGDLMMFLAYLMMLMGPLAVLATSATQFQNGLSALDRILDLLEEPREMPASPNSVSIQKKNVHGEIKLENIGFQYPGTSNFALEEISMTVQPGETVALVGPSGAGKTTLCNLVARFYDPATGRVLLDGTDLKDIDVESFRSLLGVVEQDVFLFDGTVGENISYADRSASVEDIRKAAEVANADEFIDDLPDGYDTLIGERGVKLSGGQRQRLAIARAVLADPKILILDEATSNLDTKSERLIQTSLNRLMQDRTCFVIAHRLSTISHADQIMVLENGQLREIGSHAELMEVDGHYREMVQLQVSMQETLTELTDAN